MSTVPDIAVGTSLGGGRTRPAHSPPRSALRMAALTALAGVLFLAGQTSFRHWEALAVAGLVRAVGFHGILSVQGSQFLISSGPGTLFWVDITASCSSLGPALAIALIATVMSVGSPVPDRLLAGLVGVVSIVAGNLIRIGASVIVGLLAGRVSLVLFHDWVGSIFGFAYTIGGFVLTLAILLRRRRHRQEGS
jgi:carbamoyl-phosphate synthase large subunit